MAAKLKEATPLDAAIEQDADHVQGAMKVLHHARVDMCRLAAELDSLIIGDEKVGAAACYQFMQLASHLDAVYAELTMISDDDMLRPSKAVA